MIEMSIAEARNKITSLPETFEQDPETGALAVTRRGKPVLAIMSWEMYQTILETLEILGDEKLVASLRQSLNEVAAGQAISYDRAQKELAD